MKYDASVSWAETAHSRRVVKMWNALLPQTSRLRRVKPNQDLLALFYLLYNYSNNSYFLWSCCMQKRKKKLRCFWKIIFKGQPPSPVPSQKRGKRTESSSVYTSVELLCFVTDFYFYFTDNIWLRNLFHSFIIFLLSLQTFMHIQWPIIIYGQPCTRAIHTCMCVCVRERIQ